MVISVNSAETNNNIKNIQNNTTNVKNSVNDKDKSIFDGTASQESIEELEQKLKETTDKNGVLLKAWDKFKSVVNLGTSQEKCDKIIEDYKNGKATFEEASAELEKYGQKQKQSLDLFSNIAAGVGALALVAGVTVVTGGLGTGAVLGIGAGTGAAIKAGTKSADRATNEVEGDALKAKQILKDSLSGAVTGALSALTPGTGAGSFAANGAKQCAINSAKTGVVTGAISGASNYSLDCAFEKDVKFDAGEFVESTVTGAAAGATVGVIMGGTNGALRSAGKLTAADTDVAANCISSAGYKVTGDRVKALKEIAA